MTATAILTFYAFILFVFYLYFICILFVFYFYFIFIIQALENLLLGRPPSSWETSSFFEITANLKEMDVTERQVRVAQGNQENRSEELQVASSL
jgi:hypothetical protein